MIKAVDVYHHYLGCKARFTWPEGDYVDFVITMVNDWKDLFAFDGVYSFGRANTDVEIDLIKTAGKFQLYLYDPADLNSDQIKKYKSYVDHNAPESVLWIFQNHVDAFDLIKNGEAITLPPISMPCAVCQGSGKRMDNITHEERDCLACNGTGKE